MTSGLKQRFQTDVQSICNHPFVVATVLDPQLKRLNGFPETVCHSAHGVVRDLVAAALPLVAATCDSTTDEVPAAKRLKMDGTRSAAMKFLSAGDTDVDAEPINDFDSYMAAPVETADVDLLDWWCKHQATYPATAYVARQYLSVPATSVQSERLFSATGRLISKLRSRLLPDTAEMLVFLNKNCDM